jgi:hypothetical protein
MSDESKASGQLGVVAVPYEAPKLTVLGNARELLAGSSGTQPDGNPVDPDLPTRP